jgi:hypothetical protein
MSPRRRRWADPRLSASGWIQEENFEINEEDFLSKNLLIIILVGMFWGCSTYNPVGQKFDTTAINRIELGKTTEKEVIAMLGAPTSQTKTENGIVIYTYTYGYQEFLGADNSVDSLRIQLFNGIVINKSQTLSHFN